MSELVTVKISRLTVSIAADLVVPMAIADAGEHATRRFLEFFLPRRSATAILAKPIYPACCTFFAWLERNGISGLADIEPIHVAAYVEALQQTAAKPTVTQRLAAVRMLFDWLVVGQVLAINPAHAARGPKHIVKRGKPPVLTKNTPARSQTASRLQPSSGCAAGR